MALLNGTAGHAICLIPAPIINVNSNFANFILQLYEHRVDSNVIPEEPQG